MEPRGKEGLKDCKEEQGPTGPQGPQGEQGLPGEGVYDKQTRLQFEFTSGIGCSQSAGYVWEDEYMVTKFDVDNYTGVNRIIFSASICSSEANNDCIVELYNVTDDVSIAQSVVQTNSTTPIWVDSDNIINEFPAGEIDLGIKIRSQTDGVHVSCWRAVIFLYRD